MPDPVDLPGSFVEFNRRLPTDLEPGQRILCRHAFDGVHPQDPRLSDHDREIATLMFGTWDAPAPRVAKNKVVLCCGRGGGKTELAVRFTIYQALTVDASGAGLGDKPHAMYVAPELYLAKGLLARTLAIFRATPGLKSMLHGKPSKEGFDIRRADGVVVRFAARAAARAGVSFRGLFPLAMTIDESSFCYGDGYVVNDAEIVRALTPRLVGKLLLISTPWSNEGLFYQLYERNFGAPKDAIVATAPTLLLREGDEKLVEMIESERATDPMNASREFDAVFLDHGTSAFFDALSITEAIRSSDELEAWSGETAKAAGGDLALTRDSSALAIVESKATEPKPRFRLVEVIEHQPEKGKPLRLGEVVGSFAEVLQRHGLDRFVTDQHEREAAREHADEHKISIEDAPEGARGKQETYLCVRNLLTEGRLELPNDPRLIKQLRAVVSKPQPGGLLKITSPRRNGHGDIVSALVLAAYAANDGAPSTTYDYTPIHDLDPSRWAGFGRGF